MISTIVSGRYRILRRLQSDGISDTYLAEDNDLMQHQCILKHLRPQRGDMGALQAARKLFETEAKVLGQLGQHGQIPRLLAFFEENQEFYLIEEYIDGVSLDENLRQGSLYHESQAIHLLTEILTLLQFVHHQNVIHRDIKPVNLIRRRSDGLLILKGFGAVKQVHTQLVSSQGQTGFTLPIGTRGYMPPEQQRGTPQFSSDLYALGMTIIQVLTGLSPDQFTFDARTGAVNWPQPSHVSDEFAAILNKMVRSQPQDRYQTATDVLNDLNQLKQLPLHSEPTSKISPKLIIVLATIGAMISLGIMVGVGRIVVETYFQADVEDGTQNPKTAQNFLDRGIKRLKNGDEADADADFEEVLQRDNLYANLWHVRAIAFESLGENDKAIAAFDKAIAQHPKKAKPLLDKARVLRSQNDNETALEVNTRATQVEPKNPDTWNDQSVSFVRLEKYAEALTAAEKAIQIDKNHRYAWSNKGDALSGLDRYDEAIAAFKQDAKNSSDRSYPWERQGDILRYQSKFQAALNAYEQAITVSDKQSVAGYVGKGNVLSDLNKAELAIESYERALALSNQSIDAYLGRGWILNAQGQHELALRDSHQVLRINQDHVNGLQLQSNAYLKLRQYDKAVAAADRLLQITRKLNSPLDLSDAYTSKANAIYEQRRLDDALPLYQEAAKLAPKSNIVWSNLSEILNLMRRYDQALTAADRSLNINPEWDSGWQQKAAALMGLKRYVDAIAAFDQVLKLNPKYHYAWRGKGNAYARLGQYRNSIQAFDKALEIIPADRNLKIDTDRHGILNEKGNALLDAGRSDDALVVYQDAIKINPDFADAWFNQGRALAKLNRNSEAREAYQRALQLKPDFPAAKTMLRELQS